MGFYNLLADFYEIEPTYHVTTASLQRAILQQCIHARSLLVLDGVEALIDAYTQGNATAEKLFTFIGHLRRGDGAIILTSRSFPPKEWGQCKIVKISGLSEEAGGKLFLSLLPAKRQSEALPHWHQELSRRVNGHPLSIRLLAGRFAESTVDLGTFLSFIEAELMGAEQAAPSGLEDTDRQATLYTCISYSIRCLTAGQLKLLHTVSVFKAPFMPEFVVDIVDKRKHATAKFLREVARNNKKN